MSPGEGFSSWMEFARRATSYAIRTPINAAAKPLVKYEIGCNRLDREELISIAEARGWRNFCPAEPETGYFTPPEKVSNPPKKLKDATGKVEFEEPFVIEIPDAKLRGKKALLTTAEGEFIPEKEADRPDLLSRGIAWNIADSVISLNQVGNTHYERVVPLTGPMSHTYFHWFADYLSRVEWVFKYADKYGFPTVLLPSNASEWIIDSMLYTGYPENKIEIWPGGHAKVDTVVLPSSRRKAFSWNQGFAHYSPRGFQWLSETLKSNSPEVQSDWPEAIIICRSDAGTREFENITKLSKEVRRLGYDIEPVVLSNLSLAEQIDLFQSVNFVIGAHGAGLVNIMFGENLSIVEIYSQSLYRPIYYTIAESMNHQYTCFEAEEKGERIDPDIDKVIDAIDRVI